MCARLVQHRELDRASVSHWPHRNEIHWVQGWATTKNGSSICIILATPNCNTVGARLVHHRELDRAIVSQADYTEMNTVGAGVVHHRWLDRAFVSQIGYTEMKCSGCKVGPPQRAGSSICITSWLHRNEMQWVQGWSTTESWIEHLYHKLVTPK